MPDESVIDEAENTLGERLLIARESQGISQQKIADELHLPVHYIDWIEKGDFDKLPSLVFAKGYIRGYAKIVGVDSSPLIENFNQSYGLASDTKTPIQSVSKVQEQVKLGDPVMRWSLRLFVLAIVAASVWWWKTQYTLPEPSVSSVTAGEQTGESQPVSADGNTLILPKLNDSAAEESTASGEAVELVGRELSDETVVDTEIVEEEPTDLTAEQIAALQKQLDAGEEVQINQEGTIAEIAESNVTTSTEVSSGVPTPSANNGLLIEFSDECWFSIKDANGKVIRTGIKKAGESVTIADAGKLYFNIGNAQAVKNFSYHGRKIDLAQYAKGNVAKFNLTP